ncbi:uridine-cytidine kinase 2 [Patellaria atrata CBS 101060]|uniref:Uridine kinase n=1 Tax=Patellaria atrata CBS 101060 TaxID=1346257 RepID=A0A9P4VQT4_9PEZI|nr:uridine-cytidine kinase 2 [Patellaria atrata CBS 101060]
MEEATDDQKSQQKAHYSPPWFNTSIIGIAGSSGSGKTSLALAIVASMNLPWVVIMSMDSFYNPLTPEQSKKAFNCEFDFDAPAAIDFDLLVEKLRAIKEGKKADLPIYSFEKHQRVTEVHTIYSPHVLILEGIFALHDQRVLDLLDLKIFAEADADLCLSRRLLRDVKDRGRDIGGCIKQWFSFVKPNFHRYVEPQRNIADIIIPRGIENTVAIGMVADRIRKILKLKSRLHQVELKRLGRVAEAAPPSPNLIELPQTRQIVGMNTLLLDPSLPREDFIFYFDRLTALLVERAIACMEFKPTQILTAQNNHYIGLKQTGEVSAVTILRGGSVLEIGLKRVIPDCRIGRVLIQTHRTTGEPELHYLRLAPNLPADARVLLLDSQMTSGAAALMAVRVLVDHGVDEERIVFVAYLAGRKGVNRLLSVFPDIMVVVCRLVDDYEERWVEQKYLGC